MFIAKRYKCRIYRRNKYVTVETWTIKFLPLKEVLTDIQAQIKKLTTYHRAIQFQNPYWNGEDWVDDDIDSIPF